MIAPFIDLAPGHKVGLAVENPVLLSPTAAGFGDRLPRRESGTPGAIVVGPVSATGHGYGYAPGVVEIAGGMIVLPAGFSRSVRRAVERYAAIWQRSGCPVVVQLLDETPVDFARTAARLADTQVVAGVEWAVPVNMAVSSLVEGLRAAQRVTELPLWVKLPWARASEFAERAVVAGAAGLVVARPPPGAMLDGGSGQPGDVVAGTVHGPLVWTFLLEQVAAIARQKLPCALVASGGIFTPGQMTQALAAGAHAVQLDAVVWSEPAIVTTMVAAWRAGWNRAVPTTG